MLRRTLIGLAILAGLLALSDRGVASLSGKTVAASIQKSEGLEERPSVDFGGFPFITQAVGGNYKKIDIDIRDYEKNGVRFRRITAHLTGVHLALGAALSGNADRIPVDHGVCRVEVGYPDINDYLSRRPGGLRVKSAGVGRLLVETSITVAGRGPVPVEGVAVVKVVASGLRVDVTSVKSVGGLALPSAVASSAKGRLSFDLPVSGLPFGIRLKTVEVGGDSVAITASADHFVIQKIGR